MAEQDLSNGVSERSDENSESRNENLVENLESNNKKLSEILDKMDIFIERRRSAWKERKILEENFQLNAEAYKQRLDQLSRIMIPKNKGRPERSHSLDLSGTAENRIHNDRGVEYEDSMLFSLEYDSAPTSYLDIARCEPDDSCSGNTSCGNEGFRSALHYADPTKQPAVSEQGFLSVSESLLEPSGFNSAAASKPLSDSELHRQLIENLTEARKRGILAPGNRESGTFWDKILGHLSQENFLSNNPNKDDN